MDDDYCYDDGDDEGDDDDSGNCLTWSSRIWEEP